MFGEEEFDWQLWQQMPETLRQELRDKYDSDYDEDEGPCMWFDTETRRCRNYDFRPEACRDAVELGDESCLSFREEHKTLIQLGWKTHGDEEKGTTRSA
jgi:Fe-S-cluster containining protein